METVILKAEKREETGKTRVKRLRNEKKVPAVCYKDGKSAINLKVDARELYHVLHTKAGENVLITLQIPGIKSDKTVIIKEIQTDPLKGDMIHVDFNEISLTKQIKVKVPVTTRGEAKDVVREGGVVEHIIWEVDIECLPTQIPQKIEVEVSMMKIGDSVYVKDLKVPEGVKVLNDPELVVFTAKPPAKEEALEAAADEGATDEPEVITKGKKLEEGEEGAEEEAAPKAAPKKEEKKEG